MAPRSGISKTLMTLVLAWGLAWGLNACDSGQQESTDATGAEQAVAATAQTESERLGAFFEETFSRDLGRSPMFQSYLGIKTDYDKWNDLSDARAVENNELVRGDLERLRREFDYDALDDTDKLSYKLFAYEAEQDLADFPYRFHNYPINQMFGWQTRLPAFLINIHRVTSVDDANAYVARLRGVAKLIDQVIEGLETRADTGVLPPKFVYAHAQSGIANVLADAPFEDGAGDSTLLADFTAKVGALDITDDAKAALVADASEALEASFGPAFRKLSAYLAEQEKAVDGNRGIWSLPDGEAYYARRLKRMTSTELSPEAIHQIGLDDVARIHDEMRDIMNAVAFDGPLQAFFKFMRSDARFYYPQTEVGRAAYLAKAVEVIETMKGRLDDAFTVKPKADIVVKAVEPFREKSGGKAFYQQPAPDGSRPGTYYANLHDMKAMPTYSIESLAYHEGIPGHHMQRAIQIELENLPRFRRFGGHTAYTEGWGLYAEYLGKEMGFYQDPYSDFGRLAAELWRAVRLVVDTGIHAKRWTREEAIEYHKANTPASEGDITKAVERYFVAPGQATAYKIGMRKIIELRQRARQSLGEAFDIREYHDLVLKNGPMPLGLLEDVIADWVRAKTDS